MSTASRLRRERATRRTAGSGPSRSPARSGMARVRYAFDNSMARGVSALIVFLGLAVVVVVVLFSAVDLIVGVGPTHNPITAVYNALLHTIDTGTQANDSGSGYEGSDLLVTIAGLVLFSAFIGVLATAIDERLTNLRKGRSVVLEQQHTLILGWSERVFTIISELAIANESVTGRKPAIVILADRDKVEMEDAIRERVDELRGTRIVCRTGRPTSAADLEIVAHRDARSVIVLAPEREDEPDAVVIKTILALSVDADAETGGRHIVAEMMETSNLEVARLAGGTAVTLVDKPETISRLIVQTSRQSGAAAVYRELLDFDGEEIYMRADDALTGRTFHDALHAYETCTAIGIARANGTVELNPAPATPITAGDAIVAIAEDDSVLDVALPSVATIDEQRFVTPEPTPPLRDATLVLGYNHRAPRVLSELSEYATGDSRVVVVADVAPERVTLPNGNGNGLRVECQLRSTTDRAVLDELGVDDYDRVIVLSYADDLDVDQADARTLVTLLHLRDIARGGGHDFRIVSEILDEDNAELARVADVDDIIVSDQVLSLMFAQLSENRQLADVFDELFQADGSEVYLRPVGRYVTAGEVTFATLVEAASQQGETAIGYRSVAADGDDDAFGIRINPAKSETFGAADGDLLIVLAED